jgi:hypothetical protein
MATGWSGTPAWGCWSSWPTGLGCRPSWTAGRAEGSQSGRHRSGKVLADLAVMLADGGDCLADLVVLGDQPGLVGPVASTRPPGAWSSGWPALVSRG